MKGHCGFSLVSFRFLPSASLLCPLIHVPSDAVWLSPESTVLFFFFFKFFF